MTRSSMPRCWMVLLLACGTAAGAPASEEAIRRAPANIPVEPPAPTDDRAGEPEEAPPNTADDGAGELQFVARYRLPGFATLISGGERVAVLVDDVLYRLGADGLEQRLDAESERLARILPPDASHGIDYELHEGHRFVVSYGEGRRVRTVRFDARGQDRVSLRGAVAFSTRLEGDEEAWLVREDGRPNRVARIGRNNRARWVDTPPAIGPAVPGLSGVGARACARPSFQRIAAGGSPLAALVVECHRDTPWRILRFEGDSAVVKEMPSRRFAPEVMDFLPDGRVVLAGTSPSRIAIERDDGTWDEQPGPRDAAAFIGSAVTPRDVWLLAMAEGGFEGHVLLRNGEPVPLVDPDGAPVSPRALALDDARGVVVLGGGRTPWVFTLGSVR